MPRCFSGVLLAPAGILLFANLAAAQGGTVSGTVKDPQGGVVPGASVTLISESRGTLSTPVVTNAAGDFVIPNNPADTYTVQVEMPLFRTLKRQGVQLSAGSHATLGTLTLEVGGASEVVTVTSDAPLVQAASSERSYTVATESMTSLPLALRSYESLLTLAPGVNASPGDLNPAERMGGGGAANYMVDGATALDPAVNRPASKVSVEAVSEVKVVTSGYQAEYARSSGLQINAVTKSGTNNFHGSLYDVERNSSWNANSQTNILNGDPKAFQDERDWGMTFGGPVGKPGGSNKLFFFFNLEFNPRTFGNDVSRYRMPTPLERKGDFSQSTNNLGQPFPFIRDPLKTGACNAASQVACFADGGVLGRIPTDRLYQPGLAILNWWPSPNIENVPAGQAYNFEITDPAIPLLGYQPLVRLDYQPTASLRTSFKYLTYLQGNDPIPGTLGDFNATTQHDFGIYVPSASVNWTINSTTFVEATWGANWHTQEGCNIAGGSPNFCRNGLPVSPLANRNTAGFGAIPNLFPNALQLETDTWSYEVFQQNASRTSVFDGTKILSPPEFAWGSRVANAPPNNNSPFNDFILRVATQGVNGSLTKVTGAHTVKVGYYYFRSIQSRTVGNFTGSISFAHDDNVPAMSTFGFANAALGLFNSYAQSSRLPEGAHLGVNHEFFVQDTWKVNPNLTMDYGVRFVHQAPAWDTYQRSSNFLPDEWNASQAPLLYLPGCVNNAAPCTGDARQAMHPVTKQLLGAGSALAIGTLVPSTGDLMNGLFVNGQGIDKKLHEFPALGMAPRVGVAWDISGDQRVVIRGSTGLFFDREGVNTGRQMITNPPFTQNVTLRYGGLNELATGSAGLVINAPPALVAMDYEMPLPATVQWSTGVQAVIPFAAVLDVAYAGHHLYNEIANGVVKNINFIDIGTGFLPSDQDPTRVGTSTVPGATSFSALHPDLSRYFKGYGTIGQRFAYGKRTYHGLQISLNRRMTNGVAFGFTDSVGLSDRSNTTFRVQHNPDGTITARDDQAEADELLGDNAAVRHTMRAHFTWQLPTLEASGGAMGVVSHILRDWSLSGIWSGETGSGYSAAFTYGSGGSSVNLTGSPNYAARIVVVDGADPGSGCSSDPLRQLTASAFNGPPVGSVGLDSGANYMRGCFVSAMDFALARTIRLGGNTSVQLRLDVFNTFNQAAITNRNSSAQFASPANPTAIQNLPFDANGNVDDSRSRPRGAGFGVATGYQDPRTVQLQVRFAF